MSRVDRLDRRCQSSPNAVVWLLELESVGKAEAVHSRRDDRRPKFLQDYLEVLGVELSEAVQILGVEWVLATPPGSHVE